MSNANIEEANRDKIDMAEIKGDDALQQFPNMSLPQIIFVWEKQGRPSAGLENIMSIVDKNDMAPFYEECCEKYGWIKDESKLTSMRYVFF